MTRTGHLVDLMLIYLVSILWTLVRMPHLDVYRSLVASVLKLYHLLIESCPVPLAEFKSQQKRVTFLIVFVHQS